MTLPDTWPTLATLGVALIGLYLLMLAAAALVRPAVATRFLGGFATSRTAHFAELSLRVIAGSALVAAAPAMAVSGVFLAFGWILIGTSLVLALVPWRLHQRFAAWSVPQATQYLPLIGLASLAAGVGLFAALWFG